MELDSVTLSRLRKLEDLEKRIVQAKSAMTNAKTVRNQVLNLFDEYVALTPPGDDVSRVDALIAEIPTKVTDAF